MQEVPLSMTEESESYVLLEGTEVTGFTSYASEFVAVDGFLLNKNRIPSSEIATIRLSFRLPLGLILLLLRISVR